MHTNMLQYEGKADEAMKQYFNGKDPVKVDMPTVEYAGSASNDPARSLEGLIALTHLFRRTLSLP